MKHESFILTKISPLTGNENEMEIPMSIREFSIAWQAFERGAMIQEAFHNLPAPMREFIKSGISPQEWDEILAPDDEAWHCPKQGFSPL